MTKLEQMRKEMETKLERIEMAEQVMRTIENEFSWKLQILDKETGEFRDKTIEELDEFKGPNEEHSCEYRLKEFIDDVKTAIEKLVK